MLFRQFNKEQIMRFIPHRDPFLFVDSIEEISFPGEENFSIEKLPIIKDMVGAKVRGSFEVRPDLGILAGHFPGNPILPGVVQIEMMAQVSCFTITLQVADPFSTQLEVALISVFDSKFRKPIRPGMKLSIESNLMRVRGHNITTYDAKILHNGVVMSETSLMATFEIKEKKL